MLSKKLEIISVLFILAVIVIPYAYAATEKFEVAPSTIVSKYFYLEKGYVMSWNATLSGIVSEDNPTLDIKIFTYLNLIYFTVVALFLFKRTILREEETPFNKEKDI